MTGFSGPDARQRGVVSQRALGCCEICGDDLTDTPRFELHHRQPRKMGGTSRARINSPSNLLLLCSDCHRTVELERLVAYANGWLVREPTDPARVPALTHRGGLVLLSSDGRYIPADEVPA